MKNFLKETQKIYMQIKNVVGKDIKFPTYKSDIIIKNYFDKRYLKILKK